MGQEKFVSIRNRPQPITTTWTAATNQSDTSVRTLKATVVVNVGNAFRMGFRFRDEEQRHGPPQASTWGPPVIDRLVRWVCGEGFVFICDASAEAERRSTSHGNKPHGELWWWFVHTRH